MKTTVVIPNYNGKHFLQDCLDSLLQSTVEIAVIVVDNGSTDGSVSWIQEHFPQVKLICFSENKGNKTLLISFEKTGKTAKNPLQTYR